MKSNPRQRYVWKLYHQRPEVKAAESERARRAYKQKCELLAAAEIVVAVAEREDVPADVKRELASLFRDAMQANDVERQQQEDAIFQMATDSLAKPEPPPSEGKK
jgi:uncharacterized protein YecA (UPF0149 family)